MQYGILITFVSESLDYLERSVVWIDTWISWETDFKSEE